MSDLDAAALAEGLDRAIDELLAIRVALCSRPVASPDMALDDALRAHDGYQQARRGFSAALRRLLEVGGAGLRDDVLEAEAAANAMVGRVVEVAWRLGLRLRTGGVQSS